MNNPIELDISGPGHIVEPPIIDLLAFDPDLRSFVAEFVPDTQVSHERKESIFVAAKTQTARRIGELMDELTEVLNLNDKVVKIAHAGGGDFDMFTEHGDVYHLHESPSPQFSFDVYAILQVLSQEVQLEFITQRRMSKSRVAG